MTRAPKLADQMAYLPRLMQAHRAAAYLDMGRTKFLELVEERVLPSPIKRGGLVRWDRRQLDAAVDSWDQGNAVQRRNTVKEALAKLNNRP